MFKKLSVVVCAAALSLALFACGEGETKSANLNDVMSQISTQVSMGDMMDYTTEDLKGAFGIDAADIKQCVAKVASDGITADEVIMIEAVDSDAATRIFDQLTAHYQAKANENINYNPGQYAVIEKCSVEREGNFVTLFISPDAAKMTSAFQSALK